jgi:HAD superfamily hydrolase (TIGR01490 family)
VTETAVVRDRPFGALGREAAFFDLDRTLIAGSSAFVFGVAAWRADLVPTRQFLRDAVSAVTFRVRGAGDDAVTAVRERILGAVTGRRQQDILDLNETVLPKLLESVRPEARKLLDLHHARGRGTYIVSAAPAELVEPLAQALGMTGGLGTQGVVDADGVYTGELAGPFCYGRGKVEAIVDLAHWEGFDLARCFAYSDSASDLPMLEAVGHPVAVNPDATLGSIAAERGWPVVIFSRRTKQMVRRTTAGLGAAALAGGSFIAGLRVAERRINHVVAVSRPSTVRAVVDPARVRRMRRLLAGPAGAR